MARLLCNGAVLDDWHPLDGVPAPEYIPPYWTAEHVGTRFADMWGVLIRSPNSGVGPRPFGQMWPAYLREWDDLLAIVGGDVEQFELLQIERNRVRVPPSSTEISEMGRALEWPGRYLIEQTDVMRRSFNKCAQARALEVDLRDLLRRGPRGNDPSERIARRLNREACAIVADGLLTDDVPVF
jgi:hypothetical protein